MTDDRAPLGPDPGDRPSRPSRPDHPEPDELRRIVLHKSLRRERARARGTDNVWSWMGMFGLVGWTVAVPTLLGLALGLFVDRRVDSSVSFAITGLVVGVATGATMAWYWIRRESGGGDRP